MAVPEKSINVYEEFKNLIEATEKLEEELGCVWAREDQLERLPANGKTFFFSEGNLWWAFYEDGMVGGFEKASKRAHNKAMRFIRKELGWGAIEAGDDAEEEMAREV